MVRGLFYVIIRRTLKSGRAAVVKRNEIIMIKTQEEYNNACNFIDSDMELYDFQLSEKMSSYEYNLYLQDTEYFLNFLYEKIRTLEELCDYLDEYVDTKIQNAREKIQQGMNLLEQTNSVYNTATIDTIPEWNYTMSDILFDRDGSSIPLCTVSTTAVEPAMRKSNEVVPALYVKRGENNAYYDNLMSAIQDGYYLAAYQESRCNDIVESIDIMLPEHAEFNCVDINPINSTVQIEKTDTGIVLHIQPLRYDKELRNFDYLPFTGSARHSIVKNQFRYRPGYTVSTNQNRNIQNYNNQATTRYMAEAIDIQKTTANNNNKADAIGSL